MAAFGPDKAEFNYRVAGVAIHNGCVLLDRNSRNNYWVLPGGHPEMMEPMADALRREVREEIYAEVEVVRLLWVVENFFHKRHDIHELSFYFLMQIDPASRLLTGDGPFYGEEHEHTLTFQWHPLEEAALVGLPLFPGFLTKSLLAIPESTQHIVFNDMDRARSDGKRISKSQEVPKSSIQRLTIS